MVGDVEEEVARLCAVAVLVPTVVDVYLDRPALLAPIADLAAALVVDSGAADDAVLDMLFGAAIGERQAAGPEVGGDAA